MVYSTIKEIEFKKPERVDVQKKKRSDSLQEAIEYNKNRNATYSKKLFGEDYEAENDDHKKGGIMVRSLQIHLRKDTTDETVENMKSWYSEYSDYMNDDYGDGGNVVEPIFDIIMKQNINDFLIRTPNDMKPEIFIQNYKILELADAADEATEQYHKYIEQINPDAKYANQYKEVLKRVHLFKSLKELYDNLRDVIMHPKFKTMKGDVLTLLNYDEETLRSMYKRKGNADFEIENEEQERDFVSSVIFLKDYMDEHRIKFGDGAGMESLINEAEEYATYWINFWNL